MRVSHFKWLGLIGGIVYHYDSSSWAASRGSTFIEVK